MTVVAIAGGLGDLGRTVAEEILQSKKHTLHILARKTKPGAAQKEYPSYLPRPVEIDYTSVSDITTCLQSLKVKIVISTLNLHWPGASESQINLIRAAAASGVVDRFIPSEFNVDYHNPPEKMPYGPRSEFLRTEAELESHSNLTFTLIRCGFFMDYLGLPYGKTNLHPLYCLIDLQYSKAVIPGDGKAQVTFTHTRDVGKFVTQLLSVEAAAWPREATISGQRISLNDLVILAETITGKPFEKHYENEQNLRENSLKELPSNSSCYAYFPGGKADLNSVICPMMIGMLFGIFDIQGTELTQLFPGVGVINLESFLRQCYRKRVDAQG